MITIDNNYLDRFKRIYNCYWFYVTKGVYLEFNDNLEYEGLETFYNLSSIQLAKLEEKSLNTLYKLGWIYDK